MLLVGLSGAAFLFLVLFLTKLLVTDLYHAVLLSQRGVATDARVLDSRSRSFRYSHTAYTAHEHLIQYGNFRHTIVLDRRYPKGSHVEVIYDARDPALVWQGNGSTGPLRLYLSNVDGYQGEPLTLVFHHLVYLFFVYLAFLICREGLRMIRHRGEEHRVPPEPDGPSGRAPTPGRTLLTGYILVLVLTVAALSFLLLRPAGGMEEELRQANETLRKGERQQAEEAFTAILRTRPDAAAAYSGRARVHLLNKNLDAALADLDRSMRLGKEDAENHFLRGIAYIGKEDYARALTENALALQKDPYLREAHRNAGIAYAAVKDYPAAIREYGQYLEMSADGDPGAEQVRRLLAAAEDAARGKEN